jgi:NAD(P)-dependent dehydrogenase (short-subunit alcohol dehydrogenase family)
MRLIITGAASGIGRATATLFAASPHGDARARMLLVDRDDKGLSAVAEEVVKLGADAKTLVADLADATAPGRIVDQAEIGLGGLDALISNAGAIHMFVLKDLELEEYERVFAINTRATFLLAKAAYPLLKTSRGVIVATASISSEHPTAPLGAYSASKAALVMLIRQMALEWGPDGIRCNCVSPGPTHTGMTAKTYDDPARRERRGLDIPLRRIGAADDIARAIHFLAGPAAGFVTGTNLMVDGGMTQTLMVSPAAAVNTMTNR